MKEFNFNSQIEVINTIGDFTDSVRQEEPMFFSADAMYAYENGGPITKAFMDAIPNTWWDGPVVFDSRVHMLMPKWFPCIPGWHLDDVPRTREDGQPDHLDPKYKAEHILCCSGDASLTEFALGSNKLEEPPLGEVVYGQWHNKIEDMVKDGQLQRRSAGSGELIAFNWQSWHQGTAATKSGWRWFGRITRFSERTILNKIRSQVQVYLEAPMAGW